MKGTDVIRDDSFGEGIRRLIFFSKSRAAKCKINPNMLVNW
jgi:hypothetical protein